MPMFGVMTVCVCSMRTPEPASRSCSSPAAGWTPGCGSSRFHTWLTTASFRTPHRRRRWMRRVLAPGGRVAIATWRSLEDHPGVRDLNAVAERHVGQITDSRHSFGDAAALSRLLAESGFGHLSVQTVTHDVQFADGALFARLNAMAVIGMSEKGKAMNEAERGELAGRIAAESQDAIANATKNGTFVLPLSTNIASAPV
jgi:hypothetical protein